MLELAKLIHDAIGIESPRKFIIVFTLIGALIFFCLGWLIDKGYRVKVRNERSPIVQPLGRTGDARTSGAESPAVTGNENRIEYNQPSPPAKDNPKETKQRKEEQ